MLKSLNDLLWGPGTLMCLLFTGLYLNLSVGLLPWKNLIFALRSVLGQGSHHGSRAGISPFSSLMTTLAATLGTGNIVGVATALVVGGPGALIWMELSALLGMGLILAESTLSVKYRRLNANGQWVGGPMYVMSARLGRIGRWLARLYALFAAIAALGIGSMTQANAAAEVLEQTLKISPYLSGILLSLLSLCIILGGIHRISRLTSCLIPLLAALYLCAGIGVIAGNLSRLPAALAEMFQQACSFRAAAGGAAGLTAMRWGIARGIFSNEAGLGSSAIAAAAAEAEHPVRQGYISMTGPFFDTIILCTITGLAICCSGVLGRTDPSGRVLDGAALTIASFESVFGAAGRLFVTLSIVLFAFSTILGWEYLGEKAFEFLSGDRLHGFYRLLFAGSIFIGAVSSLGSVFQFSDICNALMCVPNLICLLLLSGEFRRDILAFERIKGRKKM